MTETILEPALPIVDPHHHLWDRTPLFAGLPPATHPFDAVVRMSPRYLLDELLADLNSGHNVRSTVFVQCGAFYRADGDPAFKPVGETEFVNGVAAMSASGLYGESRVCAGIVGHVDLTLPEATVGMVLDAHIRTATERFKGIRHSASWDADAEVLGPLQRTHQGLYASTAFRAGYARLRDFGLSFDSWILEPQIPDLTDLAKAFPDTPVILDHVGTPLGRASYQGKLTERFPVWRDSIRTIAALPNVNVKLGGLAMAFCNFPSFERGPPGDSAVLAEEWRPYIETCIEAFGPERCMFESNFPVDLGNCSYAVLWNTLKRIAAGFSADEKTALFSGTATRVYRL